MLEGHVDDCFSYMTFAALFILTLQSMPAEVGEDDQKNCTNILEGHVGGYFSYLTFRCNYIDT